MAKSETIDEFNNKIDIHKAMKILLLSLKQQVLYQINNEQYKPIAPCYLVGAPGGGKTEIIKKYVKDQKWGLVNVHLALKSLEELSGIPNFFTIKDENNNDILTTNWSLPDLIGELQLEKNRIIQENKDDPNYLPVIVLFIDDVHLSSPHHLALMFELLTENRLKDYALPTGTAIVLAGNHGSNKAGSKTLSSPIVNRVQFLPITVEIDGWLKNYAEINDVHPIIIAFLKDQSNTKLFHGEEQIDTSWPSPRSWTYLSTLLTELENESNNFLNISIVNYLAQNSVGSEAALKFSTFYGIYSKINIDEIFKNAENFEIPNDYTKKYIIAFAATRYYISHYILKKNRPDEQITRQFYHLLNAYSKSGKEYLNMIITSLIKNKDLNFLKNTLKIKEEINPDIFSDIIFDNEEIKENLDSYDII
jgi:hypothetical protein